MKQIFISGNVPSSKNSKIKTERGIFHSKTVSKYLRQIGVKSYSMQKREVEEYKRSPNSFAFEVGSFFSRSDFPLEVGFHFVRDSRRKFDIINMMQVICDLLVAHRFIPDDDASHLIPYTFKVNDKYYSIDKDNPGVWLTIQGGLP